MTIHVGDWILINSQSRKYKGYVLYRTLNRTRVNVYVPELKDFSPHVYPNDKVAALPLDTFGNETELYIEAALLLGEKDLFMESTNNRRV